MDEQRSQTDTHVGGSLEAPAEDMAHRIHCQDMGQETAASTVCTHILPVLGSSGDIWEKHHFEVCCSLRRLQSKLEKCTVLRDITQTLCAFLQLYNAKVSLHYVLLTLLGSFQENRIPKPKQLLIMGWNG